VISPVGVDKAQPAAGHVRHRTDPSQASSYAQEPSSGGSRLPSAGGAGSTRSGIGVQPSGAGSIRWIIQFLPSVRNSTYRPDTRAPDRTIMTSLSRHFSVT
jgi:hypothetical protein